MILSGGELTVTIRGKGRGGPNQEYALALAIALDGTAGIAALAADTDGTDGGGGSRRRPGRRHRRRHHRGPRRALGLDPAAFLADNNSTGFFERLGDLLRPGPTFTNVNDFRAIVVDTPCATRREIRKLVIDAAGSIRDQVRCSRARRPAAAPDRVRRLRCLPWHARLRRSADFRLCNNTGSRVGIAIGYKDSEGWTTEGWWNLSARSCETLLHGALVARFYYVYAVDYDRGGEWSGKAFMCTRDKEFTISGIEDCLARGYDRTGFFEVDTGEQRSWTVQLTEATEQAPPQPLPRYTPLIPTPPACRPQPKQTR